MAVIKSVLPRSLFTQPELAGDPGPRSGMVHNVATAAELVDAMDAAEYGDEIVCDHTVTITGHFTGWKDYRTRTIDATTPRQLTRSQLLRPAEAYDPATMDPQQPIEEEIVIAQSATVVEQSAIVEQTVYPQGPPSYIRIISDGAIPAPGTRASTTGITPYATFASAVGANAIFGQEGPEFGGVGSANSYRYWWFEGLRFTLGAGGGAGPFYFWGIGTGPTDVWRSYRQLPQFFMVQRCLWHYDPAGTSQSNSVERAVQWEGHAFGVVDSGIWGLYGAGIGDNGVFQTPYGGSLQVQNCYAEGLTGLVFSGGTGAGMAGRNAGPHLFRRVHYRKPRRWQRSEICSGVYGAAAGWNVTVAADRVTVTRNRSNCDFNAQYTGADPSFQSDTFIGAGMVMYDPTTGLGARVTSTIFADILYLEEAWAGTVPFTGVVYFQSANAVYNSGRPTGGATATTSSSSPTVTFSAALPATVTTQHYFLLNTAAYSIQASPPFRRRIIAIAGDRLSCTLSGNYDVSATFPFSIVWWDGVNRMGTVAKAHTELKSGKGMLVEDTVMENAPRGAWGTTGFVLHVTSQSGETPWAEVADIRLRYCRTTRMGSHSVPTYTPNISKCRSTGRYTFQHLLTDDFSNDDLDVNRANQTAKLWNLNYNMPEAGYSLEQEEGPFIIEHLTHVKDGTPRRVVLYLSDQPSIPLKAPNKVFRDSVIELPGTSTLFQGATTPVLAVLEAPTLQRLILFGPNAPGDAALAANEPSDLFGVPAATNIGFTDYTNGDYTLTDLYQTPPAACTITGAVVTINSGSIPTTIVADVPFRATADAPIYCTRVLTRDSATQVTLADAYPGTTGAGLTGLFTFRGTATDGAVGAIFTTDAADATVTNIPSASYSEPFTRANGAGLAGLSQTWTQTLGTAFGIDANAAQVQAVSGGQIAICQTTLRSASHFAQTTLSTFTQSSNAQGGVCVNAAANGSSLYAVASVPLIGGLELWKFVGGTKTILTTSAADAVQGDVLKLDYLESTGRLTVSINAAVVLTYDDPSPIVSNNFAGIYGFRGAGGDAVSLDTFSAQTNVPLDIALVSLTSGTFPLITDPARGFDRTFLVDGDAALYETAVASYDSATQLQLATAYPGTTGSGLTGQVNGLIPTGADPGCNIAHLNARLAGVVQDYTP